mgnify:FL=1
MIVVEIFDHLFIYHTYHGSNSTYMELLSFFQHNDIICTNKINVSDKLLISGSLFIMTLPMIAVKMNPTVTLWTVLTVNLIYVYGAN